MKHAFVIFFSALAISATAQTREEVNLLKYTMDAIEDSLEVMIENCEDGIVILQNNEASEEEQLAYVEQCANKQDTLFQKLDEATKAYKMTLVAFNVAQRAIKSLPRQEVMAGMVSRYGRILGAILSSEAGYTYSTAAYTCEGTFMSLNGEYLYANFNCANMPKVFEYKHTIVTNYDGKDVATTHVYKGVGAFNRKWQIQMPDEYAGPRRINPVKP